MDVSMKLKLFLFWSALLSLSQAVERKDLPELPEFLVNIYAQLQPQNTISADEFQERCQDVSHLNFKKLDFTDVNLSHLKLSEADFSESILRRACFYDSVLEKAKFVGANLSKADFRKADLTEVDFDNAILNGARLKGAKIGGVQLSQKVVARGCLFSDAQALSSKLAQAQEVKNCLTDLSNKSKAIRPAGSHTFVSLYKIITDGLALHHKQGRPHSLIDFRQMTELHTNPITPTDLYELLKEFSNLLRTPLFKEWVAKHYLQEEISCILVVHKNPGVSFNEHVKKTRAQIPQLDLHGKISLEMKKRWVKQFIEKSYMRGHPYVDIITGRGLHNPSGIKGTQWTLFREILEGRSYDAYVEDLQTLRKNGGWKVILKNSGQIQEGKSIGLKKKEGREKSKSRKMLRRQAARDKKHQSKMPVQSKVVHPSQSKHRLFTKSVRAKTQKSTTVLPIPKTATKPAMVSKKRKEKKRNRRA
jgi:hypothetical protein